MEKPNLGGSYLLPKWPQLQAIGRSMEQQGELKRNKAYHILKCIVQCLGELSVVWWHFVTRPRLVWDGKENYLHRTSFNSISLLYWSLFISNLDIICTQGSLGDTGARETSPATRKDNGQKDLAQPELFCLVIDLSDLSFLSLTSS